MTTYRFKFTKGEKIKFIGHLDAHKAFQRSIKRANLPIAYSNGFNPHPQTLFGSPLSLGYTSDGEYGDFKLTEDIDPKDAMDRLNAVLPEDFVITELIRLKEGAKNPMASVCGAEYQAVFDTNVTPKEVVDSLEGFLNQEEIVVVKKTKNNLKETDIKPDIIKLWAGEEGGCAAINMLVMAGSIRNLKPESVAEGLCIYLGKEYNKFRLSFKRVDLLMEDQNGELVSLTKGVELE